MAITVKELMKELLECNMDSEVKIVVLEADRHTEIPVDTDYEVKVTHTLYNFEDACITVVAEEREA